MNSPYFYCHYPPAFILKIAEDNCINVVIKVGSFLLGTLGMMLTHLSIFAVTLLDFLDF